MKASATDQGSQKSGGDMTRLDLKHFMRVKAVDSRTSDAFVSPQRCLNMATERDVGVYLTSFEHT